jgi:hypothetical protein
MGVSLDLYAPPRTGGSPRVGPYVDVVSFSAV